MTLRELFETFEYCNRVQVEGNPCGWCNEKMHWIIDRTDYAEYFEDYLDCKIIAIDLDTESDYYLGETIERPVLNITIE